MFKLSTALILKILVYCDLRIDDPQQPMTSQHICHNMHMVILTHCETVYCILPKLFPGVWTLKQAKTQTMQSYITASSHIK